MKRIAHNHTIDYLRKTKSVAFSSITYSNSDEILDFEDDRIENIPEIAIDPKRNSSSDRQHSQFSIRRTTSSNRLVLL